MKQLKIFLLVSLFMIPALLYAQSTGKVAYNLLDNSKLEIDGTSTLHNFEINAKKIDARLKATSEFQNFIIAPTNESFELQITIPVKDLSSGKDGMDENMRDAFDAEDNPNITYVFKTGSSIAVPDSGQSWYKMVTNGELTIAGVKKNVNMTVYSYKDNAGEIHFKGSKKIKMTDYKIDPPTMFFGTVKTGDEVTIKFDLLFKK